MWIYAIILHYVNHTVNKRFLLFNSSGCIYKVVSQRFNDKDTRHLPVRRNVHFSEKRRGGVLDPQLIVYKPVTAGKA